MHWDACSSTEWVDAGNKVEKSRKQEVKWLLNDEWILQI